MRYLAIASSLLLLAGCSDGQPNDDTPIPVEPDGGTGAGAPPLSGSDPDRGDIGQDEMELTIPVAFSGRWGINANDCDPARDDAKGLVDIGSRTIRFYESVGTLKGARNRSAEALTGTFAFGGEGMEWARELDLTLSEDGERMIMTEKGADTPTGPVEYTKCETETGDA